MRGGFPTNTFNASNYYVDVLFDTNVGRQHPPSVVTTVPAAGSSTGPVTATARATFGEPIQPATLTMTLTGPGGAAVAGAVSYDAGSLTATFTPAASLELTRRRTWRR